MNLKDAISVVEQALEIARKAGVYTFADSAMIYSALGTLAQLKEAQVQAEAGKSGQPKLEEPKGEEAPKKKNEK